MFHLLFASIERGDSALLNDIKSKFNDAIFDFLEFFDYLHLRPHMGSGGPIHGCQYELYIVDDSFAPLHAPPHGFQPFYTTGAQDRAASRAGLQLGLAYVLFLGTTRVLRTVQLFVSLRMRTAVRYRLSLRSMCCCCNTCKFIHKFFLHWVKNEKLTV